MGFLSLHYKAEDESTDEEWEEVLKQREKIRAAYDAARAKKEQAKKEEAQAKYQAARAKKEQAKIEKEITASLRKRAKIKIEEKSALAKKEQLERFKPAKGTDEKKVIPRHLVSRIRNFNPTKEQIERFKPTKNQT